VRTLNNPFASQPHAGHNLPMCRISVAIVLVCLTTTPVRSEPFEAAFQILGQAVSDGEVPGVTALVIANDGRVVRRAAYGACDLEQDRPFRRDTICWLASITKPVTAAAVMKLVEQGKLSLDDPVEKYLPEFKKQATADGRHYPVTIRQILSHSSGITQRPPTRPPLFFCQEWLGRRIEEIPPTVALSTLECVPGAKVQYSNAAPYVTGRVVEVVSGRRFADFVRDEILNPLGMNDAYFALPTATADRLAVVYRKVDGKRETFFRFDPAWKMNMAMPDGGLFSTTDDTAKFVAAFLADDDKPLARESKRQMLTEQSPGWGLGWQLQGDGIFGHDGSSGTSAWADPATKTVGVVFFQIQDMKVTDALQARFRAAVRAEAGRIR
jgi:CubicO group peptidase (beta-lactamase class C family)